jgi:hypothetical protein
MSINEDISYLVVRAVIAFGGQVNDLESISSTFYKLLLQQYSCTKSLQSKTVTREKLRKTLSYEKGTHKMLMKLTPGVLSLSLSEPRCLDETKTVENQNLRGCVCVAFAAVIINGYILCLLSNRIMLTN